MPERFVRTDGIEMAPMKGETVLFNPLNKQFCVLNATAAFVWNVLDRPQSVREIADAVAMNFANAETQRVEQDVKEALLQLKGIQCVTVQD